MGQSKIKTIRQHIIDDPSNQSHAKQGYTPLFTASSKAKIAIIGQAPGLKAQTSQQPWNDISGETLCDWLGITKQQLLDPAIFAILPMDFYYPGKAAHGDLPPRKDFAAQWHPQILALMPDIELTILIGAYAQKHYLNKSMQSNLTQTVKEHHQYLPDFFPIVHPSPLNFRWQSKNPWFLQTTIPALQKEVLRITSNQ